MTPFTCAMARALFPAALAVAAAILVRSYHQAGDGFSAGVLAGLAALAQYLCLRRREAARRAGSRIAWPLAVSGLLLMLTIALAPVLFGYPPVTHLPRPGGEVVRFGTLEFHTALLFDLGILLLVYGGLITIIEKFFEVEAHAEEPT